MKELSTTSKMNLIKYINNTPFSKLRTISLFNAINTGRVKYNEEDILNYLSSYLFEILNGNKTSTIGKIDKVGIHLGYLLYKCTKEEKEIDEVIISRVSLLPGLYEKYCEKNNLEKNETLLNSFNNISDIIKPEIEQLGNNEEVNKKIAEMSSDYESLKKEKDALLRELNLLKISNDKLQSSVVELEEKLNNDDSLEEIKKLNKSLRTIKKESKEKDVQIESLKEEVNLKQEENDNLISQNESIKEENSKLEGCYNSIYESEEYTNGLTIKQEQILDEHILNMLFTKRMTIDDIYTELFNMGIISNLRDIHKSLIRIQRKVNIKQDIIVNENVFYTIQAPYVITNKILSFPSYPNEVKDFIFISDLHLQMNYENEFAYRKINALYNYAASKNITNIINLGDVFHTASEDKIVTKDIYNAKLGVLDQFIENLNKSSLINDINTSDIKQFILGGNHDRDFSRHGIEPIEYLARESVNIIPIGYDNAIIRFGKHSKQGEFIGLHHAGVPRDSSVRNDTMESTNQTVEYLNRYYHSVEFNQSDKYFDIFGHNHKGKIDVINAFGIVPSLDRDRVSDGAWHVKVYFNELNNIDYMVIYPLSFNNTDVIRPVMEIPYQKIRK